MALNIFKGVSRALAPLVAKKIGKEEFLNQLREAWTPVVKGNTNIDLEVASAMERVKKSGFEKSFKAVGITEEDVRNLLTDIKTSKGTPISREGLKIGRNDPCPCGSDKKYKRCCGR